MDREGGRFDFDHRLLREPVGERDSIGVEGLEVQICIVLDRVVGLHINHNHTAVRCNSHSGRTVLQCIVCQRLDIAPLIAAASRQLADHIVNIRLIADTVAPRDNEPRRGLPDKIVRRTQAQAGTGFIGNDLGIDPTRSVIVGMPDRVLTYVGNMRDAIGVHCQCGLCQ